METSVAEFVQTQLRLLDQERSAEVEESRRLYETLPAQDLEKRGLLLRLRVNEISTGLSGRLLVNLVHYQYHLTSLPYHKFQTGDVVELKQTEGPPYSGTVCYIREESVTIAVNRLEESIEGCVFNLRLLANDVTYRRMRIALEGLAEYATGKADSRLVRVLFGQEAPVCQPPQEFEPVNVSLNDSQKSAISFALSCLDVGIIHGPPGTGKTTTVVELIVQSIKAGQKVLACAPSNLAVDNIIEKLSSSAPNLKLIRIGHPARIVPQVQKYSLENLLNEADGTEIVKDIRKEILNLQKKASKTTNKGERRGLWGEIKLLRKDLKQREQQTIEGLLSSGQVIFSTLSGADDKLLRRTRLKFDLLVIDEAAQALEAACWIPILHAPRLILAGDHCQLGPTILSEAAGKSGLSLTLLDRVLSLYDKSSVSRMLTVQYRMHQKIMDFSSAEFYEKKLVASSEVASHLLRDLEGVCQTQETCSPLVLVDTADCEQLKEIEGDVAFSESKSNPGEAALVLDYISGLIALGLSPSHIGVITPYNAQVQLLRSLLQTRPETLGVDVGSVDGFQGREKEVILLSMVRSNDIHQVGFLKEDRRTNVAITRARRHLAIFGDSNTLRSHPFLDRLLNYLDLNALPLPPQFIEEGLLGTPLEISQGQDQQKDLSTTNGEEDLPLEDSADKSTDRKKKRIRKKNKKPDTTNPSTLTTSTETSETKDRERSAKDEEERRKKVAEDLRRFLNGPSTELEFPADLNSFERLLVHEEATKLELVHSSTGQGSLRHIVVSKPPRPSTATDSSSVSSKPKSKKQKETMTFELDSTELLDLTNNPYGSILVDENEEEEEEKEEASDEENTTEKKTIAKTLRGPPPSKKKNNNNQPLPKKKKSKDEEFDELMDKYDTTVCQLEGCSVKVNVLGRNCRLCRLTYCFHHALPEIHGCGEDAKLASRKVWEKGFQQAQSSTAPISATKKAFIKKSLHDKIDKAAQSRSKKDKAKHKK